MTFRHLSNSQKVILGALLTALIFVLSSIVSFSILRQNAIQDRSEQISVLTLVLAEHLDQTIYSANVVLESLVDELSAANLKTEAAYIEFAGSQARFNDLQEKTSSNPILDVATYVDNEGKVINFSRAYPAPKIDLSERDHFQYLSKINTSVTFYSDPVRNKGNGKWIFYLAKRITSSDGRFLGLALIGISVDVFSQFYEKIGASLGVGSAIALFKDDQTLLSRWPQVEDRIGKINHNAAFDQVIQNPALFGQVMLTDAPTAIRGGGRA